MKKSEKIIKELNNDNYLSNMYQDIIMHNDKYLLYDWKYTQNNTVTHYVTLLNNDMVKTIIDKNPRRWSIATYNNNNLRTKVYSLIENDELIEGETLAIERDNRPKVYQLTDVMPVIKFAL